MSQHKDKATGKWYYTGKYKNILGEKHDYKKRGFLPKKQRSKRKSSSLKR